MLCVYPTSLDFHMIIFGFFFFYQFDLPTRITITIISLNVNLSTTHTVRIYRSFTFSNLTVLSQNVIIHLCRRISEVTVRTTATSKAVIGKGFSSVENRHRPQLNAHVLRENFNFRFSAKMLLVIKWWFFSFSLTFTSYIYYIIYIYTAYDCKVDVGGDIIRSFLWTKPLWENWKTTKTVSFS